MNLVGPQRSGAVYRGQERTGKVVGEIKKNTVLDIVSQRHKYRHVLGQHAPKANFWLYMLVWRFCQYKEVERTKSLDFGL